MSYRGAQAHAGDAYDEDNDEEKGNSTQPGADRKGMNRSISHLTFLVQDYDEAIRFFTETLRFRVLEDTPLDGSKRWVLVAPEASQGAALLLAKATSPEQKAAVGNQSGGRVFLFLHTADFWGDYTHLMSHGVKFAEQPREESYGTVVVFYDLYGNKWDLVQPK